MSQREFGIFVFSKLHRFLFMITKHLQDIILELIHILFQSAFTNFVTDEFRTLPDMDDR